MKAKVLALVIGGMFVSSVMADVNAQVAALQQQVNQLQSELNSNVSGGSGTLSQTVNAVNRNVFDDYNQPFGNLPNTGLSYALMQQQDDYKSLFTLGGYLEADLQQQGGDNINASLVPAGSTYPDETAFAATTAKLYFLANPNSWTQAFITVKGGLNGNSTSVSEAFLNFGNFNELPLYLTVGKTYLPFGIFNGGGPWSNTLLTNAFRSVEMSQVILGFGKNGLNTSLAVYDNSSSLSDFSYNLQYGANVGDFSFSTGAAYENSVQGTDGGVGGAYTVNGGSLSGNKNGAIDLNGQVSYNLGNNQALGLSAEWVTTTGSATLNNVSTGKMSSWQTTGTYSLPIMGANTLFGLGYSQTTNMQNVPLSANGAITATTTPSITGAKHEWLLYATSEVLNNFYVGPEYSNIKLYNGQSTWTGTLDLSLYF